MIGVNLIPPEVRRRQARRRRLRFWTGVMVPAAVLALIPILLEMSRQAEADRLQSELQSTEGQLRTLRAQVSAAALAAEEMEVRIARARALRTKRSWSGLLALLEGCTPPEVWFTSLTTGGPEAPSGDPRRPAGNSAVAKPAAAPNPAPQVVTLSAATQLQLTGFAVTHESLYDLMSRLKDTQAFASVELVKAGLEPAVEGRAVKFVLACRWDL